MKIAFDQLGGHLEKKLRPLYILTGEEPLSMMESIDAIRHAAKLQGYDERQSLSAERNFDWQRLTTNRDTLSLFASHRLLELHIPSGKPGTDGSKALQDYAARLPDNTVTLITLPKLDKTAQASAWFSALESAAVVVPMQAVEIERLPQWIGQRLQAQGQLADAATLEFLANQVEGNLLAAHQEIQKLGLLYPPGPLDAEVVREAVLNVSRYDVFQLCDALLAGDALRTARILQGAGRRRRAAARPARRAGLAVARRIAGQAGGNTRRKLGKRHATGQNLGQPPSRGAGYAGACQPETVAGRIAENGRDRQDL
jgi:DNA polymerase III subunit delta